MTATRRRWRTAVLTGATSGIGEATARRLVGCVDRLVVQGPQPADAVVELWGSAMTVHYVQSDFTHLHQVVAAAQAIRALAPDGIELLVNDAAVPGAEQRLVTVDGFERTLQVNALAPALLTRLLVGCLAPGARIVNVGSSAHRVERFHFDDIDLERGCSPIAAYARSKLAMVTWSSLLAEELQVQPVRVVALCPGLNDTPLSAALMGRVGGPPRVGAQRVLHAATAEVPSGSYLEDDRVVAPSSEVTDPDNRRRLTALYWQRLAPFAAAAQATR